jgi:lysophospholipase L1-like esterase
MAAALLAALLTGGCSAAGGTPADPRAGAASAGAASAGATGQYVALGDSYTAGPGVASLIGSPEGCGRSSGSYPMLVARHLGVRADQVLDESCSGATIADLSGPQWAGDGTNPPQFDALSDATTLVTIGIGGNDTNWDGRLAQCQKLDASATGPQDAPCRAYYTAGGVSQIRQVIQEVAGRLAGALARIRHLAPHARVYVVGYPDLMPASGAACAQAFELTEGDMAFLHTAGQELNTMLRQQAAAAGDTYVDTYTPSIGHDACAALAERWLEPLNPAPPAVPLHPTALGEQGMADAVLRAIAAARK